MPRESKVAQREPGSTSAPLSKLIAAVQTERRKVPSLLDDDTWRDFLAKTTGQRSLRVCTGAQMGLVIDALVHLRGETPRARTSSDGPPILRRLRAIWGDLSRRGAVENSDAALDAWICRQTGLDAASWAETSQLATCVESAKAWLERLRREAAP